MTGPPFWQNLTDSTDFQKQDGSLETTLFLKTQVGNSILAFWQKELSHCFSLCQICSSFSWLLRCFEKIENRMIAVVMHCMHDVDVSYFRTSIKYTLSHQGHYKQTAIIFYQNVLLFLNHKTRLDSTQDQIIKYMMIQQVRLGFRFCLR